MTNSVLSNINRNRQKMSKLEMQMVTGKKIQRASENPIVASRALKFRATMKRIGQYETNTKDAMSWLEVTEQSVTNTTSMLKRIRELGVSGSNGSLTTENRDSIVTELIQLKQQIAGEGNGSYAGRFMFSGYRTDSSLTFEEASSDVYEITESFTRDDMETVKRVFDNGAGHPEIHEVSRIRLGYSGLDGAGMSIADLEAAGFTVVSKTSGDSDGYNVPAGTVHYLEDTGELVFNTEDVDALPDFSITYQKSEFTKGDIKPEHYFTSTNLTTGESYTLKSEEMNYQVSYSQSMQVNELGRDIFTKDLLRDLEEVINGVRSIENNGELDDELKQDLLGEAFSGLIGKMDKHIQNNLNVAAKIGGKINRLELTQERLDADKMSFGELQSENEDVDTAEVLIQFSSMEMIYNASLSASAKILQPSLLDFIR